MRVYKDLSISYTQYRYLLGSGGTLMFDVTILAQARAYRRLTKRHLDSTIVRRRDEEERGLLTSQV